MPETAQQYTQRMLNHSRGKDPVRLQQAAPRKLAALTKGLSKKRLTRRPEPGKWSIAEILAHLADAELVVGFRLRLILASNGTPIQAFDQDAWADTFSYSRRDSEDFARNLSPPAREQPAAFEFCAPRVVEELRPAPGARPGKRGPHRAHDGWPRPEPHAPDREDREAELKGSAGVPPTQRITRPRTITHPFAVTHPFRKKREKGGAPGNPATAMSGRTSWSAFRRHVQLGAGCRPDCPGPSSYGRRLRRLRFRIGRPRP